MSSLTIEMGLRRKRTNSPPVPRQIASRDDVTLAQKQRLAMLAKMGLGPVSGSGAPAIREPTMLAHGASSAGMQRDGPPVGAQADRKAALLERERRFREQEERQQEEDTREDQAKRDRAARARGVGRAQAAGSIARLGPVMPREDDIPQFLPAPMQVAPPKVETKMEIKISKETAERAKGPGVDADEAPGLGAAAPGGSVPAALTGGATGSAAEGPNVPDDDLDSEELAEDQVLAFLRVEKAKRVPGGAPRPPADRAAQKPGKKKRKKATRIGADGEEEQCAADDDGAEDDAAADAPYDPAHVPGAAARARDGGVSKQLMVVESVKGKVSNANKNLTDADLERRFSMQDMPGGGSSLMTEAEVLRLIKREKQEKGGPAGSATRRVQRELAEWAIAKEQQRARVKSPHRFERMVVSRK